MRQIFLFLASVLILPNLFAAQTVAQNDSQSLPIVDVKKVVITESVAKDAYLWGYPLVRFERTRKLMTTTPGYGHAALNYFYHANRLPSPQDRGVSNPLPDSLYSSAFIDLREQPLVLQTPKIKDRYYSLEFFDAFNNNIAIISSRTRGEAAGKFFITGPHYIGEVPMGFEHIHSATNFAWINGHIETNSPGQVKSSYKLISKYELKPYSVYLGKQRMATKAPRLTGTATAAMDPRTIQNSGVAFFDELGIALRENEPANLDAATMNRFRTANIGTAVKTSRFATTRETREAYQRAIASGEMDIDSATKNNLLSTRNAWNFVLPKGDVKTNNALRSAMSRTYFGQPSPIESLHPVTYVDLNNKRLNGNAVYILRFAKGQLPPVGAMWSVVPYTSGQGSLIANTLRRYALGSYSKDLKYNPDGSLDIYLSSTEPRGMAQNWLPVPRANFYVMVNLYNPTNDIVQGKYTLPRVQSVNLAPIISLNN